MLDELFDLFERDRHRSSNSGGGLRARLARAIRGTDDRARRHDDDSRWSQGEASHRYEDDDDDDRHDRRYRRRDRDPFDDD